MVEGNGVGDHPWSVEDELEGGKPQQRKWLVQEKLGPKRVRRYQVNEKSPGKLKAEESTSLENAPKVTTEEHKFGWLLPYVLPQFLLNFILPAGFPGTVSDDYIYYMLWQFPCNVCGWASTTIVTSSLLKAVGIDASPGTTGAASAAIKWVTKDGLGAVGRLFIGGHFGSVFDEDPKQWRMYGDLIGSTGSILELVTPLFPGSFLLLASLGYLMQAMGKGLAQPSLVVAERHFAISENMGDVMAKEEVWEVVGQLCGLFVGVFVLAAPGMTVYWKLAVSWVVLRGMHLYLRYRSLAVLRLYTINYKRAQLLIGAHIRGTSIPGRDECNKMERLMVPRPFLKPRVHIGSSLKDLLGVEPPTHEVEEMLRLYQNEKYLLFLHPNRLHGLEARILFKEESTAITVLRSMYQACWVLLQDSQFHDDISALVSERSRLGLSRTDSQELTENYSVNGLQGQGSCLTKSLHAMQQNFDEFESELTQVGWDLNKIVLRIPNQAPLLSEL